MKYVIDQNYFRSSELRSYLKESSENLAVVTDMAMFEMLKGDEPILVACKSLKTLSDFPEQILCTAGTGDLMRKEIADKKPIATPIDNELTECMRHFLREVSAYRNGQRRTFPLDEKQITEVKSVAMGQRLDHAFHKQMLDGCIQVLRKQITPELQKQIKSGQLTFDVYKFLYQVGFVAFRSVVADYQWQGALVEKMYLDYCLIARRCMVYTLSACGWFKDGGQEAMPAESVTNDLHDLDFIVTSSYVDGIFSKEKRVNSTYGKMKNLFEKNIHEHMKS